jgi:hypothetical protein
MRVINLAKGRGFAARLQRGRELAGEDRVASVLASLLDDRYHLIRHFVPPGERYDLNMILVGPVGVWHFEILHFVGLVQTEQGWMHWDYKQQSLRPIPPELIPRTRDKLARLTRHLAERGLPDLDINQVIILSTPNAPHEFALPDLQVVFFDEIEEMLRTAQNVFPSAAPVPVAQIVGLLTGAPVETSEAQEAEEGPAETPVGWGGLTRTQLLILAGLGLGVILVLCLFVLVVVYFNLA